MCSSDLTLKGNIEGNVVELDKEIDTLAIKVYKDAMVLDGVASIDDPDDLGKKVFGNEAVSVGASLSEFCPLVYSIIIILLFSNI